MADDRIAGISGNVDAGWHIVLYRHFNPVRTIVYEGGDVFPGAGKIKTEQIIAGE